MNSATVLERLQAEFNRALLDPDYAVEAGVFSETGIPARARLNVYLNNSRIAQSEALAGIYPAVRRLVGEDFFDHMAILYGETYALSCGDLRAFGDRLPHFIRGFEPLAALPYLPDVARLEWAFHESLHAAQGEARSVPPDLGATLCLAPHVRLLHSTFPVAEIWDFALQPHEPDSPHLDISDAEPAHVLILRPGLDVEVLQLPPQEWEWLEIFAGAGIAMEVLDQDQQGLSLHWHCLGVLATSAEP